MENPPLCEHGEPKLWHKASKLPAGGWWECRHRHGASAERYRKSPKGKAARQRYYEANREKILAYRQEYHRRTYVPRPPRAKNPPKHPSLRAYLEGCREDDCRELFNAYQREYRRKNPKKIAAHSRATKLRRKASDPEGYRARRREEKREYFKRHPEKARERNRKHRIRGRKRVYDQGDGTCYLCKQPVSFESFHIDHVIPVSRGGPTEPWNLRVSCATCNSVVKGDRLLSEMGHPYDLLPEALLSLDFLTDVC